MKIVKRDGRTVDYDASKIRTAIGKANNEVRDEDKIIDAQIDEIIDYIESLNKKRILVEDIQDIIEEKLMQMGKYSLAKKYIIYRYTRSIIRKSNTTDATILSLLKNGEYNSSNYLVANRQRDVMAGEASKDLAYRLLLPKNVVDAEKKNLIKFCNVEYFTEPIIESIKIDLNSILDEGTVVNGVKIDAPKSFQSVANVLVEVVAALASSQTGAIYINFSDLFKYYSLSFNKYFKNYEALLKNKVSEQEICAISRTQTFFEVTSGIQTLFYQINTITLTNGKVPRVYFLVNPKDAKDDIEEQIIHELIRQKACGVIGVSGMDISRYPMLVYCNCVDVKYEYLKSAIMESNVETIFMSEKRYERFIHDIKLFNQGSIVLNLMSIAMYCKDLEIDDFIDMLNDTLGYCYEGMLCRNHNLQGVYSDKSPIHWIYGGISKLSSGEKIDFLLKKDYSYMNLVVVGFEAAISVLGEDKKSLIVKTVEEHLKEWNLSSSFKVCLSNYYDEEVLSEIKAKDEIKFGKNISFSYFDSCEFQKDNYFKNGFLYVVSNNKKEDYSERLIIKRKEEKSCNE